MDPRTLTLGQLGEYFEHCRSMAAQVRFPVDPFAIMEALGRAHDVLAAKLTLDGNLDAACAQVAAASQVRRWPLAYDACTILKPNYSWLDHGCYAMCTTAEGEQLGLAKYEDDGMHSWRSWRCPRNSDEAISLLYFDNPMSALEAIGA